MAKQKAKSNLITSETIELCGICPECGGTKFKDGLCPDCKHMEKYPIGSEKLLAQMKKKRL
jgi:hypothetical protein